MAVEFVRVDGLRELQAKLDRIPAAVARRVLKGATLAGAREIARPARRYAAGLTRTPIAQRPADRKTPGTMAASVIVRADRRLGSADSPAAMVWIAKGKKYQSRTNKRGKLTRNRDAYYWAWVEMGHRFVPRRGKARTSLTKRRANARGRVQAYPTLGRAAEDGKFAALRAFRDYTAARIDKVMKGA